MSIVMAASMLSTLRLYQLVSGSKASANPFVMEWMGAKRVVCLRQFPGLRAGCAAQGRNLQKQGANQLDCQTLVLLRS